MRRLLGLVLGVALVASASRSNSAPVAGNTPSGRVRTLTPKGLGPFLGTPEVAARAAIAQLGSQLGSIGPHDTLSLEHVWEFPEGQGSVVRFQQLHQGHVVLDAVVAVRLDAQGRVRRVTSSLQSVESAAQKPTLTQEQAIQIARSHVNQPLPLTQSGGARLVVLRSNGGRLAWDVYVETLLPTHAITVVIDATTGEYLFQREHAKSLGQANVFKTGGIAKEARKSDNSFNASLVTKVQLDGLVSPAPGETLNSDVQGQSNYTKDIAGYDCCPTANCDGSTPPPTIMGTYPYTTTPLQTVVCDEKPIVVSDSNGDYLFTPAREPTADTPIPAPSDGDAFSVVMGYHHATEQLAYVRSLQSGFKLAPGSTPLRVTTNYLDPDFASAMWSGRSLLVINKLTRVDNSVFVPAGGLQQMYGSGFKRDFDSVMLYQGTSSDFAYDPHVVSHEFSHAVVEATAALQDYAVDDWGAVDAPGAINEGFADYWAAARLNDPVIGQYVGSLDGKSEGTLRNLENSFTCPTVLFGEVHQDSQAFSAGLWAARKAIGTTPAMQAKFDAAVLRAMPMIQPTSSFEDAIVTLVLEIEDTFVDGHADVEAAFTARGFGTFLDDTNGNFNVTGCDRVIDVTPENPYKPNSGFGMLLPPMGRFTPYGPSPVQFRIKPPAGATKVTFTLQGTDGQRLPTTLVRFKPSEHVSFSATGPTTLEDDAPNGGQFMNGTVSFDLTPDCGGSSDYVVLGNKEQSETEIDQLSATYDIDSAKAATCSPTPGSGGDVSKKKSGCQTGATGAWAAAGLALASMLKRRRRSAE